MDPKSAVGGPKPISRTGLAHPNLIDVTIKGCHLNHLNKPYYIVKGKDGGKALCVETST